MKKRLFITIDLVLLLFLGTFKTPVSASAALYVSPSSGIYYQGSSFTLGVYVSSTEPINAVEANISYDSSRLSIVACGAINSTFEMIADSSCPSITVGTTGSYSGGGAQVAYVTFRANSLGSANVTVTGRTAMNGGTVSTSGASRTYTIAQYNPVPQALTVMSASHPDSDSWYKERTVELSWSKASGVTGFSYEFNQSSDTEPDNVEDTSGTGIDLESSSDSIWYFHIKARSAGGWGVATHYKIQIDSIAPIFSNDPSYEDKGDLQPEIVFEATDTESGIDYYEIYINDGEAEQVESPYKTSLLSVGDYDFLVKVYDKAGNAAEKSLKITVGELQPPVITELIVEKLFLGSVEQRIIIRGTAPSGAKVYIKIFSEPISGEVMADDNGEWEYIYEGELSRGEHIVKVMTEIGEMQSALSDGYALTIGEGGLFSFLPITGAGSISSWLFLIGGLLFGALFATSILLIIAYKRGVLKKHAEKNSSA